MAHKGARDDLTAEYVRSILDYEPETGVLRWRVTLSRRVVAGKIAGWKRPDGRICLGIGDHDYRAHRLIWLMQTGHWPPQEIDHIDLDPSNNRWLNLRLATPSQNQANRPLRRNSRSGYTGVCFDNKKKEWIAYINKRHIGRFKCFDDAVACRAEAEKAIHREFAYQNLP